MDQDSVLWRLMAPIPKRYISIGLDSWPSIQLNANRKNEQWDHLNHSNKRCGWLFLPTNTRGEAARLLLSFCFLLCRCILGLIAWDLPSSFRDRNLCTSPMHCRSQENTKTIQHNILLNGTSSKHCHMQKWKTLQKIAKHAHTHGAHTHRKTNNDKP